MEPNFDVVLDVEYVQESWAGMHPAPSAERLALHSHHQGGMHKCTELAETLEYRHNIIFTD
jgi:hypothetical protein